MFLVQILENRLLRKYMIIHWFLYDKNLFLNTGTGK